MKKKFKKFLHLQKKYRANSRKYHHEVLIFEINKTKNFWYVVFVLVENHEIKSPKNSKKIQDVTFWSLFCTWFLEVVQCLSFIIFFLQSKECSSCPQLIYAVINYYLLLKWSMYQVDLRKIQNEELTGKLKLFSKI